MIQCYFVWHFLINTPKKKGTYLHVDNKIKFFVCFWNSHHVCVNFLDILNNDSMVFLFGIYYSGINTPNKVPVENNFIFIFFGFWNSHHVPRVSFTVLGIMGIMGKYIY
jgi:hypothetical protein